MEAKGHAAAPDVAEDSRALLHEEEGTHPKAASPARAVTESGQGCRTCLRRRAAAAATTAVALTCFGAAVAAATLLPGALRAHGPVTVKAMDDLLPGASPARGSSPGRPRRFSARMLLESSDLHAVATESLMKVGHRVLHPSDRYVVHAAVMDGFRNMSCGLHARDPELAKALDFVQFSDDHKTAVLSALRLISDPRVQSIGLDVARAIRESATKDRWDLIDRIHGKLRPRIGELHILHGELFPAPLRELTQGDRHWGLTLDPANVRVMSTVNDEWSSEIGSDELPTSPMSAMPHLRRLGLGALFSRVARGIGAASRPAETARGAGEARRSVARTPKYAGVAGGVSEEGRSLLDVVQLSGHLVKQSDGERPVAAPLVDVLGLGAALTSCELKADEGGDANLMQLLMCPLKFGAQGMDALRAVSEFRVLRR